MSTVGLAAASDADFTLKNRTGYQIDEVHVSSHASKDWGRDIMGRDALEDGGAVDISFPHGGGACRFDIQVKYHDDDSTAEWGNAPAPLVSPSPRCPPCMPGCRSKTPAACSAPEPRPWPP